MRKTSLIIAFLLVILFNISDILIHKLNMWELKNPNNFYVIYFISSFIIFLCGILIEIRKRNKQEFKLNKFLLIFTICLTFLSSLPPNILDYIISDRLNEQEVIKFLISPIRQFQYVILFLSGILLVRSFYNEFDNKKTKDGK